MKNFRYVILFTAISLVCLSGCKKREQDNIDISSIHTSAAETETMAAETTKASPQETDPTGITIETETTANAETAAASTAGSNTTATKTITYESGKVKIQYPAIYNTGNTDRETSINRLIKNNALSIIDMYQLDEATDTLEIACEVVTADKKRLTIVYKGSLSSPDAAHPVNLFYTNTIDLNRSANIGFRDYVDPYTMAGYVLSGDCQFPEASGTQLAELNKVKNETDIMDYTAMFEQADFPFDTEFPAVFSYEKQGNIYFSIPVSHALGDYAIVRYTPDTK